jgi:anti-sigma factor RsiW
MKLLGRSSADCGRVRALASQALDDELSEIERSAVTAHAQACASCDTVIATMRGVTEAVRAAPLLESAPPAVPVARRRRFVPVQAARVAAFAAALVLAALAGAYFPFGHGAQPAAEQSDPAPIRIAQLEQLHSGDLLDRLRLRAADHTRRTLVREHLSLV